MDITHIVMHCATLSEKVYKKSNFSVDGVEVLMETKGGLTYIAIRGTEPKSFKDIFRNLRIWPTLSTKYKWHSGFWKGAKGVYKALMIKGELSTNYSYCKRRWNSHIVVTGHSQGAGIALCLARQLELGGYHVLHCIGFGAPRTVSRVKGAEVGFNYRSYKMGHDIVPTLLPLGIFYKHLSRPINVGVPSKFFPNWGDHNISGYTKEIKRGYPWKII